MSKYNPFPKPLKGGNQQLIDLIEENSQNNLFDPNNVNITGGTIDGVIIGGNNPVNAIFTDISVSNLTDVSNISFVDGSYINELGGDLNIGASNITNTINFNNPTNITGNTTISGDLNVIGTINNVPVAPPLNMTIENLSAVITNQINCSHLINITYLDITGTPGISTGNLNLSSIDGFLKIICIIGLEDLSEYHLTITNLLDPGSKLISNKLVKFKCVGQSIMLLYSSVKNCYILLPGGSL